MKNNNKNNSLEEVRSTRKAYPGMFLGYAYDYTPGITGVYLKEDKIVASMTGNIVIDNDSNPPKIYVKNNCEISNLKIGDEVYSKITKVSKNAATCEILAVKTGVAPQKCLQVPIIGLIKSENVRSDYREFDIFQCFVPGDIILAKVISIDQTNFIYLSTQDVSLGVVFARSPLTKSIMMPVSYDGMICLDTKLKEPRKVAKPEL